MAQHLSDLGGENNCSAAERSIARRATLLTIELERLEAKFSVAWQVSANDLDLYQRTARNLLPLLIAIGLQRPPREMRAIDHPLFQKYLDAMKRQDEEDARNDSRGNLEPKEQSNRAEVLPEKGQGAA